MYYAFFTCFSATLCIWLQDLNADCLLQTVLPLLSSPPPSLSVSTAATVTCSLVANVCVCLVCSVRSHDDPPCTAGRDWSCQAEARRAAATNRHSCGRQCFWFLHYWMERNGTGDLSGLFAALPLRRVELAPAAWEKDRCRQKIDRWNRDFNVTHNNHHGFPNQQRSPNLKRVDAKLQMELVPNRAIYNSTTSHFKNIVTFAHAEDYIKYTAGSVEGKGYQNVAMIHHGLVFEVFEDPQNPYKQAPNTHTKLKSSKKCNEAQVATGLPALCALRVYIPGWSISTERSSG